MSEKGLVLLDANFAKSFSQESEILKFDQETPNFPAILRSPGRSRYSPSRVAWTPRQKNNTRRAQHPTSSYFGMRVNCASSESPFLIGLLEQ